VLLEQLREKKGGSCGDALTLLLHLINGFSLQVFHYLLRCAGAVRFDAGAGYMLNETQGDMH